MADNYYYQKYRKYKHLYQNQQAGVQQQSQKQSPDVTKYLLKWISIQNVMCRDFSRREYLIPSSYSDYDNDEKDTCTSITELEKCQDPCLVYHGYHDGKYLSQCVNKYRDKCTIIPKYDSCISNNSCYQEETPTACKSHIVNSPIHTYDENGKLIDYKIKKSTCHWRDDNYCVANPDSYLRHNVTNLYQTNQGTSLSINQPCHRYLSSKNDQLCVAKSRKRVFEGTELASPLQGKSGDKFKILDTIPFLMSDERYRKTIYAQWIVTDETNNPTNINKNPDAYLGFPCGLVIDMNFLWDSQDFTDYLKLLYDNYLQKYRDDYGKVIIFGHSMGCVLALRFSYYIYLKDPSFFHKKCLVLGSGPHTWIPKPSLDIPFDTNFMYRPNIKIFITGILDYEDDDEDDESPIFIDVIVKNRIDFSLPDKTIKNINKFGLYYPMTVLDTTNASISDLQITEATKYSRAPNIHDWKTYYKCLASLAHK